MASPFCQQTARGGRRPARRYRKVPAAIPRFPGTLRPGRPAGKPGLRRRREPPPASPGAARRPAPGGWPRPCPTPPHGAAPGHPAGRPAQAMAGRFPGWVRQPAGRPRAGRLSTRPDRRSPPAIGSARRPAPVFAGRLAAEVERARGESFTPPILRSASTRQTASACRGSTGAGCRWGRGGAWPRSARRCCAGRDGPARAAPIPPR